MTAIPYSCAREVQAVLGGRHLGNQIPAVKDIDVDGAERILRIPGPPCNTAFSFVAGTKLEKIKRSVAER